jgi:hypothetical protein
MKHLITRSLQKIKFIYEKLDILIKNIPIQHSYRVISIDQDDLANYIANIQIVGKSHVFKAKPEEILADDNFTNSFSQKDVRLLTYLGYLSVNSPKYKILAQRLSEQDNKILFAILKRGEKAPTVKTAEEISADSEIIQCLNQKDAHLIGYATATEQISRDEKQKQQLRESNIQ